jgi:hypothetical protein
MVENPAAALAYPAAAPPAAVGPRAWDDPRFRLPGILLGASVLAVGAFAALHFTVGRREAKKQEPTKTNIGWTFPEAGVILCAVGSGLPPTTKKIGPGSFVVIWLADPKGRFIETTWARIVKEDPADANRIFVVITGEQTPVGPRPLRKEHGFTLSQAFWMTKDCVPEAIAPLDDPKAAVLCGPDLVNFDGLDDDTEPDGLFAVQPPSSDVKLLVGRQVDVWLVSRAGKGTAWRVRLTGTIQSTGPIGQVVTIRVDSVEPNEVADDPQGGHSVRAGDTFDVTWDCIIEYRS